MSLHSIPSIVLIVVALAGLIALYIVAWYAGFRYGISTSARYAVHLIEKHDRILTGIPDSVLEDIRDVYRAVQPAKRMSVRDELAQDAEYQAALKAQEAEGAKNGTSTAQP